MVIMCLMFLNVVRWWKHWPSSYFILDSTTTVYPVRGREGNFKTWRFPSEQMQQSHNYFCLQEAFCWRETRQGHMAAEGTWDMSCVHTLDIGLHGWDLRTDSCCVYILRLLRPTHTHTYTVRADMKRCVMSTAWSTWVHSGFLNDCLSSACQPITEEQAEGGRRGEASLLPHLSFLSVCFPFSLFVSLFSFLSVDCCIFLTLSCLSFLLPTLLPLSVCARVRKRERESAFVCVSYFPVGCLSYVDPDLLQSPCTNIYSLTDRNTQTQTTPKKKRKRKITRIDFLQFQRN